MICQFCAIAFATNIAKAELGVAVGLISAAFMNGADTDGHDLLQGAVLGGVGAVGNAPGAAATVVAESIKDEENE